MLDIKRTFIITSVIHFSQQRLSYSDVRSVYTPEERVAQTLRTISSIREKVPGALIVLVELGREGKISGDIKDAVDKYVFVGNNWLVKWACNGKNKGLGEAMGLLIAAKSMITGADVYFKISGRYFLNEDFNLAKWERNKFYCKQYEHGISTRLYSFDASFFADWQKALKKSLYKLWKGNSIEDTMITYIQESLINKIQIIGLSGHIAPTAEFLSE